MFQFIREIAIKDATALSSMFHRCLKHRVNYHPSAFCPSCGDLRILPINIPSQWQPAIGYPGLHGTVNPLYGQLTYTSGGIAGGLNTIPTFYLGGNFTAASTSALTSGSSSPAANMFSDTYTHLGGSI